MKKINTIGVIIGIIAFLIAGYIVADKILQKEEPKTINKEEELQEINSKLKEVGSPLGWLIVKEGIENQTEDGKYTIKYK